MLPEMGVKRPEVLREIIPDLARVAVLWTNLADAAEQLREIDSRGARPWHRHCPDVARSTLDLLRIVDQIGREDAGFKSLWRSLGRHHDLGRPSDAHRIVGDRRVRASPDPATD